jgi:2-amino-4-hydroxy-6-hydroxymethyldihydropteridine diphosphokinase
MTTTYLLLGSNLGEKKLNIDYACELLTQFVGDITQSSSVYETEAWGFTEQPIFYNQVVALETIQSPEDLLLTISQIEEKLGREREEKWRSRIIDIDILYYGDLIYQSETLTIPHPEIQNRKFTLIPLAEIAPHGRHPVLMKTNQELLANCKDTLKVQKT